MDTLFKPRGIARIAMPTPATPAQRHRHRDMELAEPEGFEPSIRLFNRITV